MRPREIDVSEEFIDSIAHELERWAEDPSAKVFSDFLADNGIAYSYFKYFIEVSPLLATTFEVVKAKLVGKWVKYGLIDNKDLPPHKMKLMMRYLKLYDDHGRDVEDESKARIIDAEEKSRVKYAGQQYAGLKLKGPYAKNFDANVNKRRSREVPE